jgi:hypothetical protein
VPESRVGLAVALGAGVVLGRAIGAEQATFARLAGWSIAGPDAAGWITDFLNAAYYRRPEASRELGDLRLAFGIVTTYWARKHGRRLHAGDVLPFHRAFGRERYRATPDSPRGTLNRAQLLRGAGRLLGDWFGEAWDDAARRGWAIGFRTPEARAGFRPETRLELAQVHELTPPGPPGPGQVWHTYPPVEIPSAERVTEALLATETWPDYATEVGRFTALRSSPLLGQTFEIEVAAGTESGRPVFQRGYVTITRLVDRRDQRALEEYFEELEDGLARFGRDGGPRAVPEGGEPLLGFDLTTHRGHFMGHGRNRLIMFRRDGRDYLRAAGTWDPMPWHAATAYELAGRQAQQAFWGEGAVVPMSMLHQLARHAGA